MHQVVCLIEDSMKRLFNKIFYWTLRGGNVLATQEDWLEMLHEFMFSSRENEQSTWVDNSFGSLSTSSHPPLLSVDPRSLTTKWHLLV